MVLGVPTLKTNPESLKTDRESLCPKQSLSLILGDFGPGEKSRELKRSDDMNVWDFLSRKGR